MEEQELYNKYAQGKHWKNHPTAYAETFADFLKTQDFRGFLLDIGCGNGRDTHYFSQHGFDVLGIDNNQIEIERNKQKYPELRFEVQNIENLAMVDASIGACFMINVIHYVKKEEALGEVMRVLQPGGYLFIHFNLDITDKDGIIDYHHEKKDIMRLVSKFNIKQQRIFKRIDPEPVEHTHTIMELILQKPLVK